MQQFKKNVYVRGDSSSASFQTVYMSRFETRDMERLNRDLLSRAHPSALEESKTEHSGDDNPMQSRALGVLPPLNAQSHLNVPGASPVDLSSSSRSRSNTTSNNTNNVGDTGGVRSMRGRSHSRGRGYSRWYRTHNVNTDFNGVEYRPEIQRSNSEDI